MFNVTVDDSNVLLFFDFKSRRMVQYVKQGIQRAGIETASYVKVRHLTGGTTEDRLGVRTGILHASAHGLKPVEFGDRIIGGAGMGGPRGGGQLVYAPVHINREGTKTTITPKRAKLLAVPFRSWQSRTGPTGYGWQRQESPKNYPRGFFFKMKTKNNRTMLVHAEGKGKNVKLYPYFMLLPSVTVPARVYPERVAMVRRRYIVRTIRDELIKMLARRSR
jgi:hypothetical protein